MSARFVFGLIGFLIVAAFLDDYDKDNRTNYTWYYTALIWLVYLTANRAAFGQEIARLTAYFNSLGK